MRATLWALLISLAVAPSALAQSASSDATAAPDAASTSGSTGAASAAEPAWRHAGALTGDPRYPADFKHFDYVNPEAPKGGRVRLADPGGYDTFNPILQRGNPAPGISLIYDPLMTPSMDEQNISASYGLIADRMRYPDDFAWVEYHIDTNAKWHDGTPITAEDVAWTLTAEKEADPNRAFYYKDVVKAEVVDDGVVRFTFARPGNRELPYIVGQLQPLPKAWWTGTAADGSQRSITQGTLEPPLGSGPYKIARFEPGRFIEYDRVDDYWAKDLPSQVGTNNFDTIRYDVYRDQTILVEAFKGGRFDWRTENSAKNWATAYESDALKRGDIIKEEFPIRSQGVMQAFVMNLRLPKFQDERIRRALNLMYDFESQKRTIFYDQYDRISSYFMGTELASTGLPEGKELEILEEVKDLVPASVFTEPYTNPVGGTPEKVRANALEAVKLFREAGYEIRDGRMVNVETGQPFVIDFVDNSPASERYVLPYANSLKRIGINLNFRVVDSTQYVEKVRTRDFEMSTLAWGQSSSPGNEQAFFWGSEAADQPQSQNYAGIKDPGIDALIEKVILAKDREELVAATHALDRVLLAHNYVVPLFYSPNQRTARWNIFGRPDDIPPYGSGFPTIWWYDSEKAATVEGRS
ncbi:extracellular solute-binding protein [Acuticoccus sediminis]|uniref:extracellular solute-binding protein n=1 Tax=Acuticoccus sediminis TaxID=2184697 RepID=UPI001CFE311D|nr:extracellular solute-binding protein [Acuticoccus sediminis]